MNRNKTLASFAALLLSSIHVPHALADSDFLTQASPAWTRPMSLAEASASSTTYQYWNGDNNAYADPQVSYDAPFSPDVSINPNGAASAVDSTSATDNVFYDGHDLYSFSGILTPQVTIPQYTVTGQSLNVMVQVQYFGSDITSGLLVTYTDAGNVQQSVQFDTLPNSKFTQLTSTSSETEFGPADQAVDQWIFTVPNTSDLQLDWTGWDYSSALQDISVDTQSIPSASVPEPASFAIMGLAGALLLKRKKRTAVPEKSRAVNPQNPQ